jgi:site-specific recombinase XerD
MEAALTAWQQYLSTQTDCSPTTITEYVADVRRFMAWIASDLLTCRPADVSVLDAKAYRQFLFDAGRAPATINRALVSLTLFFDVLAAAVITRFAASNVSSRLRLRPKP